MFEKISIGIRTFLRDEQLFNTIAAIRQNLPGAQMIIADCGDMTEEKDGTYADLERAGNKHIQLPYDAGFGMMSNAIAKACTRPYLLIGSDDFDFDLDAAEGVRQLCDVLNFSEVDIASGRVNNKPYEFFLHEIGSKVVETRVPTSDLFTPWYYDVDLTVNYSLIRMNHFKAAGIHWDDDVKIGGGEHGSFFVDCKRAGLKTVYVSGVNINEQKVRNSSRYNEHRRRANSPDRPCFVRRGITEYILGDGRIDYRQ